MLRQEHLSAPDQKVAADHGGAIKAQEHGDLIEMLKAGLGPDEPVNGIKERVSEGRQVNQRARDGSDPNARGADLGDAVLPDREFKKRGPIKVGLRGDQAFGHEMNL